MHGFGFQPMPEEQLKMVRSELRALIFPGTEVRLPQDRAYMSCCGNATWGRLFLVCFGGGAVGALRAPISPGTEGATFANGWKVRPPSEVPLFPTVK
jgi:hypothetical protein